MLTKVAFKILSNKYLPSVFANNSSAARSGWGIMPNTFLVALQTPAILSIAPLGFASDVISPSWLQYLKITCPL